MKLVIESNEKGKQARALVPVLNEKIVVLDSALRIADTRIKNYETWISLRDQQIYSLQAVVRNDSIGLSNLNRIVDIHKADIKILEQQLRTQKRKTFLVGLLGILGTGFVTYLAFKY